jgi:hypothetical protein
MNNNNNNNKHARVRQAIGFIAIVHTPDSVSFTTTAGTRVALISRLAEYVYAAAGDRLSSNDSKQVRALLEGHKLERGIERYFRLVGERWDDEWLVTAAIGGDTQTTAFALVDGVVPDAGGIAAVA